MKNQVKYLVFFEKDGLEQYEPTEAWNPGNALAICQRRNPGARMIRVERWGEFQSEEAHTFYPAPPVQREASAEPKPYRKPDESDGKFPFFDEVLTRPTQ